MDGMRLSLSPADLRALSSLGRALWADEGYSERVSVEILTGVAMMDLPSDRAMDRISEALLNRALKDGIAVNGEAVGHPFFRLLPQERFTLAALHLGRWSYERVGRILGKAPEQIARIAWNARLHLSIQKRASAPFPHPAVSSNASKRVSHRCPDYDPSLPWTQKFLDEELGSQQKYFLQNHMLDCTRCRELLMRSRDVYYRVDSLIPRPTDSKQRLQLLEQTTSRARALKNPLERSFWESLEIFLSRKDIRLTILVSLAILALLLKQ